MVKEHTSQAEGINERPSIKNLSQPQTSHGSSQVIKKAVLQKHRPKSLVHGKVAKLPFKWVSKRPSHTVTAIDKLWHVRELGRKRLKKRAVLAMGNTRSSLEDEIPDDWDDSEEVSCQNSAQHWVSAQLMHSDLAYSLAAPKGLDLSS